MKPAIKQNLIKSINKFSKSKILIVGDIILDEYVKGDVSRISPEAPVPVVSVKNQWYSLGGAGNVANNLAALGASVKICAVTGKDYFADVLKKNLKNIKTDISDIIADRNRPTILKTRIIARNQQVVRVDVESRDNIDNKIISKIIDNIHKTKDDIDAIVISDYGKGLVIPEIISEIIKIKTLKKIPVIVDPKVEHFMQYKKATIMTPNIKEASEGIKMNITDEKSLFTAGKKILEELELDALLITRSEEGMSLFKKNEIFNIPTEATEVYDVTGAGDTVVSVLALCLSVGANFKEASILSNIAAGETVRELGAATVSKNQLLHLVKNYKRKAIDKIHNEKA